MKTNPIKRSDYIITFSRDHHGGLLFCWKIKQGLKNEIAFDRIDKYVQFFWEEHLKQHFQEEEELLFNRLQCRLTDKGRDDHRILTRWFQQIIENGLNTKKEYDFFAELLKNHIRFEERELFPYLETELPVLVLEGIRDSLAKTHEHPFIDNYTDEFWVK